MGHLSLSNAAVLPTCTAFRPVFTTSIQLSRCHCFSSFELNLSVYYVAPLPFCDSGHILTLAPAMHTLGALKHAMTRSPLLSNGLRNCLVLWNTFSSFGFSLTCLYFPQCFIASDFTFQNASSIIQGCTHSLSLWINVIRISSALSMYKFDLAPRILLANRERCITFIMGNLLNCFRRPKFWHFLPREP